MARAGSLRVVAARVVRADPPPARPRRRLRRIPMGRGGVDSGGRIIVTAPALARAPAPAPALAPALAHSPSRVPRRRAPRAIRRRDWRRRTRPLQPSLARPGNASHMRTHPTRLTRGPIPPPPLMQPHICSQMPTAVCLLFVVRAAAARLLRSVAAPMHLLRLPIRLRLPRISPLRLGVSRWGWGVGRLSLRADHGGRAPACRFHSSFQVL